MNTHSAQSHSEFSQSAHRKEHTGNDVRIVIENRGKIKTVVGSIDIDQPPEKIWPIVANPFEFQQTIYPRMKRIELMRDEPDRTLMKVSVDCGILPQITYVVECKYIRNQRVIFNRVDGIPKYFTGYWQIEPLDDGARSRVTYSLFVDPGIAVPQWLVREALKVELPKTLRALRHRVNDVYAGRDLALKRSILAARTI